MASSVNEIVDFRELVDFIDPSIHKSYESAKWLLKEVVNTTNQFSAKLTAEGSLQVALGTNSADFALSAASVVHSAPQVVRKALDDLVAFVNHTFGYIRVFQKYNVTWSEADASKFAAFLVMAKQEKNSDGTLATQRWDVKVRPEETCSFQAKGCQPLRGCGGGKDQVYGGLVSFLYLSVGNIGVGATEQFREGAGESRELWDGVIGAVALFWAIVIGGQLDREDLLALEGYSESETSRDQQKGEYPPILHAFTMCLEGMEGRDIGYELEEVKNTVWALHTASSIIKRTLNHVVHREVYIQYLDGLARKLFKMAANTVVTTFVHEFQRRFTPVGEDYLLVIRGRNRAGIGPLAKAPLFLLSEKLQPMKVHRLSFGANCCAMLNSGQAHGVVALGCVFGTWKILENRLRSIGHYIGNAQTIAQIDSEGSWYLDHTSSQGVQGGSQHFRKMVGKGEYLANFVTLVDPVREKDAVSLNDSTELKLKNCVLGVILFLRNMPSKYATVSYGGAFVKVDGDRETGLVLPTKDYFGERYKKIFPFTGALWKSNPMIYPVLMITFGSGDIRYFTPIDATFDRS